MWLKVDGFTKICSSGPPKILKFAVSKLKTSSIKLRVKSQPNNLVPKIKSK